jgi:hypothetical protein
MAKQKPKQKSATVGGETRAITPSQYYEALQADPDGAGRRPKSGTPPAPLKAAVEWTTYTDEMGFSKVLPNDPKQQDVEIARAKKRAAYAVKGVRMSRGWREGGLNGPASKRQTTALEAEDYSRFCSEKGLRPNDIKSAVEFLMAGGSSSRVKPVTLQKLEKLEFETEKYRIARNLLRRTKKFRVPPAR